MRDGILLFFGLLGAMFTPYLLEQLSIKQEAWRRYKQVEFKVGRYVAVVWKDHGLNVKYWHFQIYTFPKKGLT